MTRDPFDLYQLLPQVYRLRDADRGFPLRTLLEVLAEDHAAMVDAIAALYDDWFIETCAPEVVPALGALVGVHDLAGSEPDRALVADAATLAGRKGTVAALELVAADAVVWPARVTEAATSMAVLASARFPDVAPHPLPDLRRTEPGALAGVELTRLPDVRDPHGGGRGKPTSAVVELWRLRADTSTGAPAHRSAPGRYTFDPMGASVALAVDPAPRLPGAPVVADLDVAAPIGRVALTRRLGDYYGPGRSIEVTVDSRLVPLADVVVGDLGEWEHRSRRHHPRSSRHRRHHDDRYDDDHDDDDDEDHEDEGEEDPRHEDEHQDDEDAAEGGRVRRPELCLDPVLGRLSLTPVPDPDTDVRVSYSRLVAGTLGSSHAWPGRAVGTSVRFRVARAPLTPASPTKGSPAEAQQPYPSVRAAVEAWVEQREAGSAPPDLTVEVLDDAVHPERLTLDLYAGERLVIQAAVGRAPVLAPLDDREGRHRVHVHGHARPRDGGSRTGGPAAPPEVAFHGVRIEGGLHLAGPLASATLDHCTVSPASRRDARGRPDPAVRVDGAVAELVVSACLSGGLRIGTEPPERGQRPEPRPDLVLLRVSDSVLDGGDQDQPAVYGPRRQPAAAALDLARCTVLGSVLTDSVGLVQDCIVTGRLDSARRQHGEVSSSYLLPSSRTPRRRGCQPDEALAERTAVGDPATDRVVLARVEPVFDSVHAGDPAYARLSLDAPPEVTAGAHDGGELGAFHDEWSARRVALLRRRLAGFVPVGTDIDIRFAT